jgi:hypothetical protein
MRTYRCLFRDDANRVQRMDQCEHPDDEAALRWGEQLLSYRPDNALCEVWQESRLVLVLNHGGLATTLHHRAA